MIKIRLSHAEEVDEMMGAEEYEEYIEREAGH